MVRNESGVARDFYTFLVEFFKQNPNLSGREIFVTGESYAGHYIPAIGSYIVDNPNKNINLAGVAIGNGWVDPYH